LGGRSGGVRVALVSGRALRPPAAGCRHRPRLCGDPARVTRLTGVVRRRGLAFEASPGSTAGVVASLLTHRDRPVQNVSVMPHRFEPIQADHGVHAHQVLRSIENPNDVIVTHTFDPPETARAFFATPELKEAMSQAGVNADSVEISYFDEVETGALVGA